MKIFRKKFVILGTRSAKTELIPFKKGAFHLALQAQVCCIFNMTRYMDKNFFEVNCPSKKAIDILLF
jgi:1-acyl-sn-glycerol-3-phosphate acyltransferase